MECYGLNICLPGFILLTALLSTACLKSHNFGQLLVRAPNPGNYEIYRIESEDPLQFISEQVGNYNNQISLAPGHYLILADCSYETVVLRPGERKTLIAHQVMFVPPVVPQSEDHFSIQCNRFTKTKSRQFLVNRFSLNILHGDRDLLVGMVPLNVNFPEQDDKKSPKIISYNLSGFQVASYDGMKPKTKYFVSPVKGLLSVTENQEFGRWQFLLPGHYRVEVNGTQIETKLAEGEKQIIQPAFLRISVSDKVNLQSSSSILGSPLYVELNDDHWLDLNETYPVLPGTANVKLNGSKRDHQILLEPNKLSEKRVRSVTIDLDCSPWDWSCLGSREVYLYDEGKAFPFAEGTSDVPLLFFEESAWVSIQETSNIRYKLPDSLQDVKLSVGFVKFIPRPATRLGQVTDLSRIEATGSPLSGHSLDLTVDQEMTLPLLAGRYTLAQYHALTTSEWERSAERQSFTVEPGATLEIPYQTYVSDRKFKQLQESNAKRQFTEMQNRLKLTQWKNQPLVPVKAE